MCSENQTSVTQLKLLGFGNLFHMETPLFMLILLMYNFALIDNTLIIIIVLESPRLHSPLYFFLSNLSLCEIIFTTSVTPTILHVLWISGGSITWYGCIAQFYLCASTGAVEILLLTIMAYDRYQAICNPLRYPSVMNTQTQSVLISFAWIAGFFVMSISAVTICSLQFCGSSTLDHVFCDIKAIIELSTMDTSVVRTISLVITVSFCFFPFLLIVASYISIFITIIQISSRAGRVKTFSTCSAHLASVCLFFGSLFAIYLEFDPSRGNSKKLKKILSLSFIVLTPLLNPVIYSLRNHDIKIALKGCINSLEQKYFIDRHFPTQH